MNLLFTAIVNGAVLGVLITAAVWIVMQLVPRRVWNASTRYAIWWVTMIAATSAPLLYVPRQTALAPSRVVTTQERAFTAPPVTRAPLAATVPIASSTPNWFGILWLSVTTVLLGRLGLSLTRVRRLKRRSLAPPPQFARAADEWLSRCGADRQRVRFALSNDIGTPMAVGFIDPMILFPAKLVEEIDIASINAIGMHEAAHLARYDDIAILPQRAVQAVFPWNPAVYFISRCIDMEREIACDDMAVRATGSPTAFARSLTSVAEMKNGNTAALTSAISGRSHLSTRVALLLSKQRPHHIQIDYMHAGAAVATVITLLALAAQVPSVVAFAAQQQLVRSAVSVTDPRNRFVTGLQKEHFRVLENGVEREIAQFMGPDDRMAAVIVVDAHSLQHNKLALEATAILVRRLQAGKHEVATDGVQSFDNAVAILRRAGQPRKMLIVIADTPANHPAPDRDMEVVTLNPGMPDFITYVQKVGIQLENEYVVVYNSLMPDRQPDVEVRTPLGLPELKAFVHPNSR